MNTFDKKLLVLNKELQTGIAPPFLNCKHLVIIKSPSIVKLHQYTIHHINQSSNYRSEKYKSLQLAMAGTSVVASSFRAIVPAAMSGNIVLANIIDIYSREHLAGVVLYCDSFEGYIKQRRIRKQLADAGLSIQFYCEGGFNLAWEVKFFMSALSRVFKAFLKRLYSRLITKRRVTKEPQKSRLILFHGSAPRIWEPLMPLIRAVKNSQNGLKLAAAFSFESVFGTPRRISWDYIYPIDLYGLKNTVKRDGEKFLESIISCEKLYESEGLRHLLSASRQDLLDAYSQSLRVERGLVAMEAEFGTVHIVTSAGLNVTTAAMFKRARESSRTQVSLLPHGLFDSTRPEFNLQPLPSSIICWSESMAETIKQHTDVQCHTVGLHKLSGVGSSSSQMPCDLMERKRRVLVAFGRPDKVLSLRTFERAVSIVESAARKNSQLTFVVRRHPSDVTNYWGGRLIEMPPNVMESDYPIIDTDIGRSFVVITMHSTVGLEAIAMGSAVIAVRPDCANYAAEPDYVSWGAAALVSTGEEMATTLDELNRFWPEDTWSSKRSSYAESMNSKASEVLEALLV